MMLHRSKISKIMLSFLSLFLLDTGPLDPVMVKTVSAAQVNAKEETRENVPPAISGRVTDVITAAGFTYAEVDTGKEKVWTAAPGVTPLKIGDTVAFPAEMPMQNFHSKSLGRDFSLIYFIKQYVTDKETPAITKQRAQTREQPINEPVPTAYSGTPGEVKIGGYLREATMTGLNGKNMKLSDLRGKPLIINVWASWCGPCRAEMGSLERLAKRYNGKEFNIIGISTDDYHNRADAFVKQTGITFKNYLDSGLLLENMLGANTLPLTILVDDHGRVLEKVRGSREWDNPKIIDAIAQIFQIELMHDAR